MDRRERKLKRENWLERNGKWYYVFKGMMVAGIILSLLNWGVFVCGNLLLAHYSVR